MTKYRAEKTHLNENAKRNPHSLNQFYNLALPWFCLTRFTRIFFQLSKLLLDSASVCASELPPTLFLTFQSPTCDDNDRLLNCMFYPRKWRPWSVRDHDPQPFFFPLLFPAFSSDPCQSPLHQQTQLISNAGSVNST